MQAIADKDEDLETDLLPNWQPVPLLHHQLAKKWLNFRALTVNWVFWTSATFIIGRQRSQIE